MAQTPFGNYLRSHRVAKGLSLREVADGLGVSHVFLGEVERGARPTLKRDHWPALIRKIPSITVEDLERATATTKPLQLFLGDAPPRYQDLGLALARRFRERNLAPSELDDLLRILDKDRDE